MIPSEVKKLETLTDLILNEEEAAKFPVDQLFDLLVDDTQIIGPLQRDTLKSYLETNKLDNGVQISVYQGEEWSPLFTHPFFQRRRPQIVPETHELENNNNIYVLRAGEKFGPFKIEELKQQVSSGQIALTDMISLDGQEHWQKLFTLPELDRRNYNLPHVPQKAVFEKGQNAQKIHPAQQEELEAIVGLVYVSNIKNGRSENTNIKIQEEKTTSSEVTTTDIARFDFSLKKPLLILGAITALLAALIFIQTDDSTITPPKVEKTTIKSNDKLKSNAQVYKLQPMKTIKPTRRPPTPAKQAVRKVTPPVKREKFSSYKQSAVYQKRDDSQIEKEREIQEEMLEDPEVYQLEEELNSEDQELTEEDEMIDDMNEYPEDQETSQIEEIPGFTAKRLNENEDDAPDSEAGLFEEEVSY